MKKTETNELLRSKDIPVLRGELGEFQKQITSFEISVKARFDSMDSRFDSMDSRFDSRDKKMDAGFAMIESKMHQMMGLMEQQNSRNIAVIDSHNQVTGRLDELNVEVSKIKKEIGIL